MSQGIQERNLPVADSIGEGDKVRIVTAQGNSKNVDASQIGGGGNLVLTETVEEIQTRTETTQYLHTLSATFSEMVKTIQEGGLLAVIQEGTADGITFLRPQYSTDEYASPYRVIDAETAQMDVGYYFDSPWSEGKRFYSATPDGAMTYISAGE